MTDGGHVCRGRLVEDMGDRKLKPLGLPLERTQ